jgi:dipeptidyl aminopeptidase/acylaminoacyl peptidase
MTPNRILLLAVHAALVLCTGAAHAADSAAAIPVEQFFQRPAIAGATMSPDGRYVAVRRLSAHGRIELAIVDVAARKSKPIVSVRNADVRRAYWVSAQRLMFTVDNLDQDGELGSPGMYAIDRDGKNQTALSPTIELGRSFAEDTRSTAPLQGNTASGFALPGEEIPVTQRFGSRSEPARMDTRTGATRSVDAPDGTFALLQDAGGVERIATASDNGKYTVYRREGSRWNALASFEPDSADAFEPALYVGDNLYVIARNGGDTKEFYRYDWKNKKLVQPSLIVAPGFDVDGSVVVDDKAMLGYHFATDGEAAVWFDPAMQALQQEVDQLLPGTINSISRGRQSETPYVLINSWSDRQDHQYSVYNRETRERVLLAAPGTVFQPAKMATVSMVRYPARDGLEIPLYLTVPAGAEKKKLPTVVLVGSQPWSREAAWDWNAEAQFLAARGYVVLEPQARGTRGFGARHASAGNKQWGLAMQDDLADAVRWSVAQGHTDPARVCIAGTGYGGYAAMMGLVRDAEVYRCGISWSGITDLAAMTSSSWSHFIRGDQERTLARLVGDPDRDAAQFKRTSPLENAARITRPVLLAYGTTDKAVSYRQGKKFYEAVRAGNPAAEWLSYTPTVADWTTQKNRIDLWRHIEQFLGKHIGAQ